MKNQRSFLALLVIFGAALLLNGCGATVPQLQTRAAFDFDCQPDTISVRALDPGTRVAAGCGKQAVYVENFNNSRHATWLLNSEVKPQSGRVSLSH
jgi:hypothetical protein